MSIDEKRTPLNDVFKLPHQEALEVFYERMITVPVTAIESLKKELNTAVGNERSKGIFIRYGWHNGVSDGERALTFQWQNELELIRTGPRLHKLHGYVKDVVIDDIKYDQQHDLDSIDVSWYDSFEVDSFPRQNGFSESPVCHMMCGYASGYLSVVLKRPILVQEHKCKAMGADKCEVRCIPLEKWGEELESEYKYYQSTSMIEELDEATAQLKTERDYLNKANNIQKQLIEELLSKKGLQRMVKVLSQGIGLPVFIEDENQYIIAESYENVVDFDLDNINENTTSLINVSSSKQILRTPIYLEQQIKGYCSFIYSDDIEPNNLEYMVIEQASLTAAIIMLNEKVKINTEQNIRRSFLNDVLGNKLEKDELYKIAYYLNLNPDDYFWMFTIEKATQNNEQSSEMEVNENLIRYIHAFFRERNVNAIIAQQSQKIVVLIEDASFQELYMKQSKFIHLMLDYCKKHFSNYTFYVGVSSLVQNIGQLSLLYNETLAALTAKNPEEKVQYFEDLGIENVLFQIPDEGLIDRFVDKQVGDLLAMDEDLELVKTLYAYIENGININNTSKAIAMSISGLRYRLSKISDILNIDFNDTKDVFAVYMALNVLKTKGKIDINLS